MTKRKPVTRLCRRTNEAILAEEQEQPAAAYIWDLVDDAIPFEGGTAR